MSPRRCGGGGRGSLRQCRRRGPAAAEEAAAAAWRPGGGGPAARRAAPANLATGKVTPAAGAQAAGPVTDRPRQQARPIRPVPSRTGRTQISTPVHLGDWQPQWPRQGRAGQAWNDLDGVELRRGPELRMTGVQVQLPPAGWPGRTSWHRRFKFRQAGFIKPLMAEQQRHVSCVGDGRN